MGIGILIIMCIVAIMATSTIIFIGRYMLDRKPIPMQTFDTPPRI